ncbi:MAG: emopamil-binding family protein [Myxococcales bacterium]|nr:emopamil-binding family protein [Myxococcales bacterium]
MQPSWQRRVVLAWSLFAGIAVMWDLSWCFMFRHLQSPAAAHDWRIIWTTYGLVDHRFLRGDGYLLIVEMLTGFGSLLHFYVAHELLRGSAERARVALVVVSIMDLYGALIYFGAEALVHFVDIDTTSVVRTWVLFVGLNSLWLIFPSWCIYLGARVRGKKAPHDRREPRVELGMMHSADVRP